MTAKGNPYKMASKAEAYTMAVILIGASKMGAGGSSADKDLLGVDSL